MRTNRIAWTVLLVSLVCSGCVSTPTPTSTPEPTRVPVPLPTVSGPPRLELRLSPSQRQTISKQNASLLGMGFQPFEHITLAATRNGQPFTGVDCQIQAPLERNNAIAYPNGNFVCFFSEEDGSYTEFEVGENIAVKAQGERGSAAELMFSVK